MITDFLSAELTFKAQKRSDEGHDLVISLSSRSDAAFEQVTTIWCVTEKDIAAMVAELEKAKNMVAG